MRAILLATVVALSGCTNPEGATQVLAASGYSEISITGYEFFGCGEDDLTHTGFTAASQSGSRVTGVVCGGLFLKGATVRITGVAQ